MRSPAEPRPSALDEIVDTDRYPITDPTDPAYHDLLHAVRAQLDENGCSVLADLVRPELLDRLRAEGDEVAPHAYHDVETVNVYNTAPDPTLPADHPAHRTTARGNAFVARDRIPEGALIQRLYPSPDFRRFVADCFGLATVYPLADPLSGLTLNVVVPGRGHPWHFDTNEFTVSLLTRSPDGGGVFEYCPGIRSPAAENLDDVRAVLDGDGGRLVRRLTLRPGDLQLFTGRYSLHRVTEVAGATARHTAIFAYSERPDVIGTVARTRQLFGRVTRAHLAADAAAAARVDGLLI
ncbi:HalD/BesD family halogenase [Pseudonocardia sp.]|uniref:HalD/BesD family halogenase n=1 Tax=Pseudonocardia sp. TaxID=60912 RepID=UPI003D0C3C2C